MLGLNIYYFADKYNVINRRTIKESIGVGLAIEMIELLEFCVIFHSVIIKLSGGKYWNF